LASFTDLRVFGVYPGPNLQDLKHKIYAGSDIVIGTSKRLSELYNNSGLNLNDLQILILDQADFCLRTDFSGQINRLSTIRPKIQRMVFSNHESDHIDYFLNEQLVNPLIIPDRSL